MRLTVLAVFFEFLLYFFPAIFFLSIYCFCFGVSLEVVPSHLSIFFSFWLGLFGVRLTSWWLLDGVGQWLQKITTTSLFLVPSFFLSVWYFVVLLGLFSWGRVTTWDMIKGYQYQLGYILDVLAVPLWLLVIAVLLAGVFFAVVYRYAVKLDVVYYLGPVMSWPILISFSALGIVVALSMFISLQGYSERHQLEPVSLSFSPQVESLQSHAVAVSPVIEAAENRARSSYHITSKFNHRNVILIVGDALRADHMSFYGYGRETTPLLNASANQYQTLKVPNIRSVCAESSCGLMALASSRPLHLLPAKPMTLQSVLRRNGYSVRMILVGDHTNFYGLKKAYGEVDDYFDGTQQESRYLNDDRLLEDYVAKLPRFEGRQPVMMQFHLMSTHALGLKYIEGAPFGPVVNYYSWPFGNSRARKAPSLVEAAKAVNYYDSGVLQFDKVANSLLRTLDEKGYLDDAVIVFTADHGEMLGEKGLFGHQYHTDEQILHIPFVLQRRGYIGEELGHWPMASQVDIAPTILKELGIASPSVWAGVALQSPEKPRLLSFQQAPLVGVYSVDDHSVLKYVRDVSTGKERVFDILKDPDETQVITGQVDENTLTLWRAAAMGSVVSEVPQN